MKTVATRQFWVVTPRSRVQGLSDSDSRDVLTMATARAAPRAAGTGVEPSSRAVLATDRRLAERIEELPSGGRLLGIE